MTTQKPNSSDPTQPASPALEAKILATINKKSFCTLATTSPAGRPHVAGVVYEVVDSVVWIHASRSSRKARSIAVNPHVAICIPYRRLPAGPPFTIHFQATAELVDMDAPRVTSLLDQGELKSISGHGALEMPDGCFIAVRPGERGHSYGPGAKTLDLIRDPLNSGARTFDFPA